MVCLQLENQITQTDHIISRSLCCSVPLVLRTLSSEEMLEREAITDGIHRLRQSKFTMQMVSGCQRCISKSSGSLECFTLQSAANRKIILGWFVYHELNLFCRG